MDLLFKKSALNPNKAGLFESSFFWKGVNLTPFIFQEERM